MKWIDGFTWKEKIKRKETWHRWFAWYPVMVAEDNGRKVMAWWEYVERRHYWIFEFEGEEFREIANEKTRKV